MTYGLNRVIIIIIIIIKKLMTQHMSVKINLRIAVTTVRCAKVICFITYILVS